MSMIFFNMNKLEEKREGEGISPARLSLMLTSRKNSVEPRASLYRELKRNEGMCQSLENASLFIHWYGSFECVDMMNDSARCELQNLVDDLIAEEEEQKELENFY